MRARRALISAAVVAGAVGLAAWLGAARVHRPAAAADQHATPAGINVVFVLIDMLRADHLSVYGYGRPTSPVIDEIAKSGVRFAHVQSQASWTKASMASMWSGAYPVRTGVLRYQHGLPDGAVLPPTLLQRAGFRTAGIWRNGWVGNNFGFGQGFDVYYLPAPQHAPGKYTRRAKTDHPLVGTDMDVTESMREFLRTYGDERFFLYLHYMDVHQYVYDEQSTLFGPSYMDAYDNAINWVDRNIGMLVNELADHHLLERTLLIVSADHGEAFMEHGREGHARDVYREVTDVPCVMRLPGLLPAGIVVEPLVQNVDVWPTILDLLGLPAIPGAQGVSLRPLIDAASGRRSPEADRIAARPSFAHMDMTWGQRRGQPHPVVGVTESNYRLIRTLTPPTHDELFDWASDPREQKDVAAEHPDTVAALGSRITEYLASGPAPSGAPREVPVDEMRLQQLRALGYIDSKAAR